MKNIGIITSGGDCGGLNGVIKGAALTGLSKGYSTFIIPNGYAGLYNLIDLKELTQLTHDRIEQIPVYLAGSEAGNSRVKISKSKTTKIRPNQRRAQEIQSRRSDYFGRRRHRLCSERSVRPGHPMRPCTKNNGPRLNAIQCRW